MSKYLWELAKLFKGKRYIAIKPTIKCNLNCSYCSVINASKYYKVSYKTPPAYKEMPPEYWMKVIKRVKPDLITFTGGEPGLYKGLADVVNYAVKQGCLVQILSNLTVLEEFFKIEQTWRVYFIHTIHPGSSLIGYKQISEYFHITLRVLKENPVEKNERQLITWRDTKYRLMYAPNGMLFDSCDAIALGSNAVVTNSITL
jgi:organic radical activating enzyme